MECPYCDRKCGTHAQCVKCEKGEQIMNEKPIPQALREQADAIEKLAQRIAKESQKLSDEEDYRDGGELADALFAIQSKLRYEYFWIAEAMWDV
jgi:hypothetical protein